MKLMVNPGMSLRGVVGVENHHALPGDKSLSHRAALFAALAQGESRVENFLVSGVTHAMLNVLTDLKVAWQLEGDVLRVTGQGFRGFQEPSAPLNCGNSATTMRLLAGALALSGVSAELTGSEGLRRRPMGRIVEPLRQMNVPIVPAQGGTAPLVLSPRAAQVRLSALDYDLPVASAQVKSCLILAALAADGCTTLREPGPSRDHSERMLRSMGVDIVSRQFAGEMGGRTVQYYQTDIQPVYLEGLSPLNMKLPGDISSAAFLIVAALITPDSQLVLRDVGLNPTRTGLLDVLIQMGGKIEVHQTSEQGGEPVGDVTVRSSELSACEVSGPLVVRMIDEFPAFAAAAAFARGKTLVRDAKELRTKESDRISALCQELRTLGVSVTEFEDGFEVQGGQPEGGSVQTHGDHRLAMSLALIGLASKKAVCVQNAEMIAESFPQFVDLLASLGADLYMQAD